MVRFLRAWLWNIFIGIDQLLNALALGDPDETLSSRMGKAIRSNRCVLCRVLCRLIGKFDPNHCHKSIEADEGKDAIVN